MTQIEQVKKLRSRINFYTQDAMALTESLEKAIVTGKPQWEAVYKNEYSDALGILRELNYMLELIATTQQDIEELS